MYTNGIRKILTAPVVAPTLISEAEKLGYDAVAFNNIIWINTKKEDDNKRNIWVQTPFTLDDFKTK